MINNIAKKIIELKNSLLLPNVEKRTLVLSFPRSGNHLTRYLIEFLTCSPTIGIIDNQKDNEIYKNIFPENLDFLKITEKKNRPIYQKLHFINRHVDKYNKRIIIVRKPTECITSHILQSKNINNEEIILSCKQYVQILSIINNDDLILKYSLLIKKDEDELRKLFNYLPNGKNSRLEDLLKNIDLIYEASKSGKNRAWGGYNSSSKINFYTDNHQNLTKEIKSIFLIELKKNLAAYKIAIKLGLISEKTSN